MALLLDESTVAQLLRPADALAGVEQAFRLLADGDAVNEPRRRSSADGTTINVMWSLAPTLDALAVKCYPVVRSDVSQAAVILITLFSHTTGECLGSVQGDLLGQRRTAAASGLATSLAARPDSRTLTIFGAGYQAAGQVHAVATALPQLRDVLVVGRDTDRRDAFIHTMSTQLPELTFRPSDAEAAVRGADVVVTATSSPTPVFDGSWLRPGTHVNAIGSNQRTTREIDRTTLDRAAAVMVDSRAVADAEGGDLLANDFDTAQLIELGDVLTGREIGRSNSEDITIFDSHGLALQDLVCALHVLRAAERLGVGRQVNWPHRPLATV